MISLNGKPAVALSIRTQIKYSIMTPWHGGRHRVTVYLSIWTPHMKVKYTAPSLNVKQFSKPIIHSCNVNGAARLTNFQGRRHAKGSATKPRTTLHGQHPPRQATIPLINHEGTHHTRETSEPHDSDSEDEGLLGVSNTYVLQVKCTYCSSRNQRIMMVANSFSLNSGDAVNTAKTLHFTDLSNYQRIH